MSLQLLTADPRLPPDTLAMAALSNVPLGKNTHWARPHGSSHEQWFPPTAAECELCHLLQLALTYEIRVRFQGARRKFQRWLPVQIVGSQ